MSTIVSRRRLIGAVAVTAAGAAAVFGLTAGSASARSTLTVCTHGCTFRSLRAAVAAARDGDTIRIGVGTYAGGVTLGHNLSVIGAGAGQTTIRGIGNTSVITIGTYGAKAEPSVQLRDVTITGGVVRSSPESIPFVGAAGVFAAGGGIEIPPNAARTGGATVHLTDVVVSGNQVSPSASVPLGPTCPNHNPCPYAEADGGGIDNWGDLTLDHSVVRDNVVGSVAGLAQIASDANGGGIMSRNGHLVVRDSVLSGNAAGDGGSTARFADGGGLFAESGNVLLSRDTVTSNRVSLEASLPDSVDLLAIAGGIHLGGDASAAVSDLVVSNNAVRMTNSVGDANATAGGLQSDIEVIHVTNTTVSHNSVTALVLGASTGTAQADSGSGELSGFITDSRLDANTVTARSVRGNAKAYAGASIFGGSAVNTEAVGNQTHSWAPNGTAQSGGGAFVAGGPLSLTDCRVSGNRTQALGHNGFARGGGIYATLVQDGPPSGPIQLKGTTVMSNRAAGNSGVRLQGGGIFTTKDYPLTLRSSAVSRNRPDNTVVQP